MLRVSLFVFRPVVHPARIPSPLGSSLTEGQCSPRGPAIRKRTPPTSQPRIKRQPLPGLRCFQGVVWVRLHFATQYWNSAKCQVLVRKQRTACGSQAHAEDGVTPSSKIASNLPAGKQARPVFVKLSTATAPSTVSGI